MNLHPDIAAVLAGERRWAVVTADCLSILPTIPAGSVGCIVADPPYGHNSNNGDLIHRREAALGRGPHGEARAIANDGAEANEVFREALPEFNRVLSPGCCCCCCCCGGGGPDPQFARWSLWLDEAIGFKQMVVWDKGPMGMGWHYRRSYETVLVAEKPGAACRWFDRTDRVENIVRPGDYGIRKIIPSADDHPTPKPWELAAHFVGLHTEPGDVVLDPFAGHGWVGVACAKLGRRFIGIEISDAYVRIARRRIAEAAETLWTPPSPRAPDPLLFHSPSVPTCEDGGSSRTTTPTCRDSSPNQQGGATTCSADPSDALSRPGPND